MKKKTRLIILLICVALFLITAPYIVLYSMGYHIDFSNQKIVATGGIYVRAEPTGVDITINNTIKNTTGYFYNSVFVQNLLPTGHTILIQKEGYYDYNKNLTVKENEVTKLENVTLFKKDIDFEVLTDATQFAELIAKPIQKPAPLLKNLIAYIWQGNLLLHLNNDGLLYNFDSVTKTSLALSTTPIAIDKKVSYTLQILDGKTFLKAGATTLLFNETTKNFVLFYSPVTDLKLSPDGQKILYFNDKEIHYYVTNSDLKEDILLYKNTSKITDCYWLNNDYILFLDGQNIIISEIDIRGNVNTVMLPQKADQIFFNQQDKKLYILNQGAVMVSERLLP